MKTLISVTTVCLNAEKDIEYTIDSVLDQNFADYEYLIQDGGSDDSTIKIAEKYRKYFENRNIPFRIISEKDEGLYDAMNKAAGHSSGEWIIYINAGDALFDRNVLKKLSMEILKEIPSEVNQDATTEVLPENPLVARSESEKKDPGRYDVFYGNAVMLEKGMYKLLRAGTVDRLKVTNPICHQASITRTEIIRKYPFDSRYKIAADFNLFLKLYLADADRIKKTDLVFSVFRLGGISNSNIRQREKEFDASRKENGMKRVLFPGMLILAVAAFNSSREIFKEIMGKGYYSESRGWFSDRHEAVKTDV